MTLPTFQTRRSRAFLLRHEFSTDVHPLHVGLWRDHAYKFFGRDTECLRSLRIDSLRSYDDDDDYHSSSSSLFVSVILVDSLEFVTTDDRLRLLCSARFLSHYSFADSDVATVSPVVTFPLTSVTLTSSNDAALTWLESTIKGGNFAAAIGAARRVLALKNDVLLLPVAPICINDPNFRTSFLFDVSAVDCQPVQRGHLTVDTEIVLKRRMKDSLSRAKKNDDDDEEEDDREENDEDENEKGSVVVRPRILRTEAQLRRLIVEVDGGGGGGNDDLVKSTIFQNCDDLRKVVINVKTGRKLLGEAARLGCNGWVLLSLARNEDEDNDRLASSSSSSSSKPRTRSFQDCYTLGNLILVEGRMASGGKVDDKEVAITPSLWYNLNRGPRRFDRRIKIKLSIPTEEMIDPITTTKKTTMKTSALLSTLPPFASEVHVSAIPTTHSTPHRLFKHSFKLYFEKPRIVSQGDTICVNVGEDPDYLNSATSNTHANNNNNNNNDYDKRYLFKRPWMFYKVVKVKSHVDGISVRFALVDSHHTTLIQAGMANDPVPAAMARWFEGGGENFHRIVDGDEHPLRYFLNYVNRMEGLILPVLEDEDDERKCGEDGIARILLTGPKGVGKTSVVEKIAADCHLNLLPIDCLDLAAETLAATEAKLKRVFLKRALEVVPCILLLKGVHHLAKDGGGAGSGCVEPRVGAALRRIVSSVAEELRRFPLILVGTTHDDSLLAPDVHDLFLHRISMKAPSLTERKEIVESLFDRKEKRRDGENAKEDTIVNPLHVAQQTAGFLFGDLLALAAASRREASIRILAAAAADIRDDSSSFHAWRLEEDLVSAIVNVSPRDVAIAVASLQSSRCRFSHGGTSVPTTRWEDIGGFEGAKRKIRDTLCLPLSRPDLFSARMSCSGILLHGPPGTGKTLFAKAIASEFTLNFVSIKGPELLNMYVGQSEKNVRRVFEDARDASPCVVFFDELDALAPNRGFAGDAGGVMDRVVSQLCAELDGLNLVDRGRREGGDDDDDDVEGERAKVFVIGATNRPDLIDPALIRPGRLEKMIFLGPAEDPDDALAIFKAVTKDFHLHKNCSIEAVARMCPIGMTGAEIAAVCSDALTKALERKVKLVERKRATDPSFQIGDEEEIVVDESDFVYALQNVDTRVWS